MTSLMAEIPTRYYTLERKPELWENYEEYVRNFEIIFKDKDERAHATSTYNQYDNKDGHSETMQQNSR
jgi:hypothetical protein